MSEVVIGELSLNRNPTKDVTQTNHRFLSIYSYFDLAGIWAGLTFPKYN